LQGVNTTTAINTGTVAYASLSTSTNILKVLGNSGDKVIATGFDDSTIDKPVNGGDITGVDDDHIIAYTCVKNIHTAVAC
jgi:hypothetical protein